MTKKEFARGIDFYTLVCDNVLVLRDYDQLGDYIMDFADRFSSLLHTHLRRYHEFTDIEANNEVYYVMTFIGVDKLVDGDDLEYGNRAYVFPDYPRRGCYKRINRAKKVSIALSINTCLNYAEFPIVYANKGY